MARRSPHSILPAVRNELPAFITQRDQLIQFGRISLSDKSTIPSQQRQIRRQRTVQPLDKCRVFAELFGSFDNRRRTILMAPVPATKSAASTPLSARRE